MSYDGLRDGVGARRAIERLVEGTTGANVTDHLSGRLAAHVDSVVRRLALDGPAQYLDVLRKQSTSGQAMLDDLLAEILVHETFFHRFSAQLNALEREVLSTLREPEDRPIRLWSAGCSRGAEPYTLAMLAARALPERSCQVLATDLCGAFLDTAREALYEEGRLRELPSDLRARFFEQRPDGAFVVIPEIRQQVTFRKHNLLSPPPALGFDVVACRNVLMYLRPDSRRAALEHLVAALAPRGVLLVGHSESLRGTPGLRPVQRLALGIYTRAEAPSVPPPPPPQSPDPLFSSSVDGPAPTPAPAPLSAAIAEDMTMLLRIVLDGAYDAERHPAALDRLKDQLGAAVGSAREVRIEADGATFLDGSTAALVARAAHAIEAQGGHLFVAATRRSVRRWADRWRLPLRNVSDVSGGERSRP